MKTFSMKPLEMDRRWFVIDAADVVLGRLSVHVANLLRGKQKPIFTPHVDCGDYVVVINSDKVYLSGDKLSKKKFYWHTGYPGGIKERTMEKFFSSGRSDQIIINAVRRMVPRGPLGRAILTKLKVYRGSEHPHSAQSPQIIDIASLNVKNCKRN